MGLSRISDDDMICPAVKVHVYECHASDEKNAYSVVICWYRYDSSNFWGFIVFCYF